MPKKTKDNTYAPAKDLCQTPAYALEPLWEYLDWSFGGSRNIIAWEPACGEGYMSDALSRHGYQVIATDILYEVDFFEHEPIDYDVQITNPPFSIKYKWLKRSYELGRPFALLMPVDVLAAKAAQVLFDKHGVEVLMLDKRVNFKMPNMGWDGKGADFSVAWFTWKLQVGRTITWLNPINQKGDI